MHLHINPHDQAPVYRQIQRQIARAIADREIHPGEPLQPQQNLASQLAVSPAAVRKAYKGLQAEGLCDESGTGSYRVTNPELGSTDQAGTDLALSLLRREFLDQELQTAREVQKRLLPSPTLSGESWTLNGRCYPAGALAGDFYEVVRQDADRIDLILADVAGKGLAAGLIMAATRSMIPLASTHESVADAMNELNERLLSILSSREFVALVWARFDPVDGSLELANAGLPDPYLLRHGRQAATLETDGARLPLGIRQEVRYSTSRTTLRETDRLLLVTDGILEAVDAGGDPVGYEGFQRLLDSACIGARESCERSAGQWLDRLLDRVSRQTGSMLDDDWTAVLLEYQRP